MVLSKPSLWLPMLASPVLLQANRGGHYSSSPCPLCPMILLILVRSCGDRGVAKVLISIADAVE
jgi:hypothetical protein